jgi:hypothetical protein
MTYECLHFHPSQQANKTEGYLLIKNNLTHIYPLKLVGSAGRGIFKIEEFFKNTNDKPLRSMQFGEPNENGADLFFNLNQKENIFEIKNIEYMNKKGIPKNIIPNFGNEKLTVDHFSLKRQHKKIFRIKNIGNFPSEIKSVTLSNHQLQHKEFSLKKLNSSSGELYEITFKPDFRHSRMQESILVKTKYSVTEFKIEGFIPMNLIQFIDGNFRLTEIEESIGNWYYLIVLSFVLLTVF